MNIAIIPEHECSNNYIYIYINVFCVENLCPTFQIYIDARKWQNLPYDHKQDSGTL